MKSINLFGEEQEFDIEAKIAKNNYKARKKQIHYRTTRVSGRGTAFYCCKRCRHMIAMEYHDKIYFKCKNIGISNSGATDIRLSYVCNFFEQ